MPFAGWRLQLAAIVAPTFAVLPWAWSRLRESPLWLLEHGQPDAAADVLQRLASDNGRPLDAAELKQLRELAAAGGLLRCVRREPEEVVPVGVVLLPRLAVAPEVIHLWGGGEGGGGGGGTRATCDAAGTQPSHHAAK